MSGGGGKSMKNRVQWFKPKGKKRKDAPTQKSNLQRGKARGLFPWKMECWGEELGKVSASFCFSRLFLCSYYSRCGSHTPVRLFPRLRTPPCRPRTSPEARSKNFSFLFFFFSFFVLFFNGAAYHLDCAKIRRIVRRILWYYCAKPSKMRAYVRLSLHLCPKSSHYFTSTNKTSLWHVKSHWGQAVSMTLILWFIVLFIAVVSLWSF